jgi:hypothetical protein
MDASPGPERFETGLRQPGRGSFGSVHHASQRRARRAFSCESAHSASDLDFATLPPRLGARRRFASEVSPSSAIRSMQRSGFPRRCTFRLRRRRSTSAATSIVGTSPSKASSSPTPLLPRGRAAEPSVALRRTTECRSLPDTGLQSCMVAHAASDVAFDGAGFQASLCDGAWCLDCEPRTPRRSPFDDRRAFARVDGLEPRNRTRRPVEPLLEIRRAPFVIGDAGAVGWRSARHPLRTAALRRQPERVFDRGSPSTCAPRRATPLTNRGAIRRRSLVRTHAADCSAACLHARAGRDASLLKALRSRNLDAFST